MFRWEMMDVCDALEPPSPVFESEELKPFKGKPITPIPLPRCNKEGLITAVPVAVLDRKIAKEVNNAVVVYWLIQWSNGNVDDATWEVATDLQANEVMFRWEMMDVCDALEPPSPVFESEEGDGTDSNLGKELWDISLGTLHLEEEDQEGNDSLVIETLTYHVLAIVDGQSIDVDEPTDIIDVVDEDDDIIDEEDPIPHDLADSDDEDLVNLDINDSINVVYSNVAYQVLTGCEGCLGNQGKGTRKPNLGGRRAGRLHTRQENRNLGLKAITDKSGPVPIRFEVDDRETLIPLSDHAAHWANYLRELVRGSPLHYPSWCQMPPEWKAGAWQRLGPSLTCVLTQNPTAGDKYMRASSSTFKRFTMMETSATREYPSLIHTFFLTRTVGGVFLNPEDKA
nr:hypothetical protein [Tanacetum cinerariifolium]